MTRVGGRDGADGRRELAGWGGRELRFRPGRHTSVLVLVDLGGLQNVVEDY